MNTLKVMRPVYAWAFIEALIFWYAIEKILWDSSGISAQQIVILGLIAQSGQVLFEVPSSILADRWSRRKTLIAASIAMLIAILIAISVQTFISFAIMSLVWALYYSLQSGTINAYIYDLLKEQKLHAQYRRAISRYSSFQMFGLLTAALSSKLIVDFGGLLAAYWFTIPPTLIAIAILWRAPEPRNFHLDELPSDALQHVRSAVSAILARRWVSILFLCLAIGSAGRFIWFEYYQLFALTSNVPTDLFGAMLSLIFIGNIFGAELSRNVQNPRLLLAISFPVILGSLGLLLLTNSSTQILALLATFFIGSQAVNIVFDENVQHAISSELRATTLSLAGLLSRIIFAIGALAIILSGTNPQFITISSGLLFIILLIYHPVRKRLIHETP